MTTPRNYFLDGMTRAEADATLQALAAAGYTGEIFPRYGSDGFGVGVMLERDVGLAHTTLAPMTTEQWTRAIAQCFIDSEILARKDEARSRKTGEPIWYKQQQQ